ncbi:MAG: hypothetical protein E6I75_20805, partial [Chloroflexi bacterium]
MSNQPDDAVRLPPEVESQLNERLAVWARARRLGSADLEAIRGLVLARVADPLPSEFAAQLASSELVSSELDPRSAFDAEWLWSLLRPVTALM